MKPLEAEKDTGRNTQTLAGETETHTHRDTEQETERDREQETSIHLLTFLVAPGMCSGSGQDGC